MASVSGTGQPHVTPLWFAWDGAAVWLYSIVDSQRWTDLTRDGRVALVVDDGEQYGELRGVEMVGVEVAVGEVPRGATPSAELATPERLFSEKYFGAEDFVSDGLHVVAGQPASPAQLGFTEAPRPADLGDGWRELDGEMLDGELCGDCACRHTRLREPLHTISDVYQIGDRRFHRVVVAGDRALCRPVVGGHVDGKILASSKPGK
ncbi:pyridoxamine 5'-phosphate oxidase family protein [Mycobacterium sp. GA-2829]|uniref:pyridoxamine 5'-phosphate oxidase family protein n=1 Tax=Mycobacterium sp. GA-2829 TaxID=1772283 RepID=UPI001E5CFC35|nr:pyridoxamine 5'-phosphate oxidase family protein [Mycobacterium sp. GA-2829]